MSGITPVYEKFPALRHQAFRWFLFGHAISIIGSWMQRAASGWYVQTLTREIGSEYWLGLAAAYAAIPLALLSAHGGIIADRVPKRNLLIGTQAAMMVAALLFGTMIILGVAELWHVLCFAIIMGTMVAYDLPARQAFTIEMVGRQELGSAVGLNSAVFNAGRLLGPAIAGLVITAWGVGVCFLLNGLSFVGVIVALWVMRLPPASRPPSDGREGLVAGFRAIAQDSRILGLIAILSLMIVSGGAYVTLLPAYAENYLGVDERGFGFLLTANGFGALLGALSVASARPIPSRRGSILAGAASLGGGLLLLSQCTTLWGALPTLVIVGYGLVLFLASLNTTVQLTVPDDVRGRVMGIWTLVFGASQPAGSYLCGVLGHLYGTPTALSIQGLVCIAGVALAWRLTKWIDH